jgi:hypothetical protein
MEKQRKSSFYEQEKCIGGHVIYVYTANTPEEGENEYRTKKTISELIGTNRKDR